MGKWNKIAGWYIIIVSIIALMTTIYYIIINLQSVAMIASLFGLFTIGLIIMILLPAFLIILGIAVIRNITWAKVVGLIIFLLSFISYLFKLVLSLSSVSNLPKAIFYAIAYLIGIVLIGLSLKKK